MELNPFDSGAFSLPSENQVERACLHALEILARYHDGERSSERRERMQAECQVLAGQVAEWCGGPDNIEDRIVNTVRDKLLARYGHEVAPRLLGEFVAAFRPMNP